MTTKQTPMMKQYMSIRRQLPDNTVLLFRLGDFYELFFDDARVVAQILDITLTKRHTVPMCGIPYHALDNYLDRLIKAGKKVAVCEQVEDPSAAKGIVKRAVARIVTPGTVINDAMLDARENNYLAALCRVGPTIGLAYLDLSTGGFWVEQTNEAGSARDSLNGFGPRECVVPADQADDADIREVMASRPDMLVSRYDDWTFEADAAHDILVRHFRVHSLKGFGCDGQPAAIGAAGAALHYVANELMHSTDHVQRMRLREAADYLVIDETSADNLELVAARGSGRSLGRAATLLGVLDATKTAMGSRLLRDWVLRPLADLRAIRDRHDAVDALCRERGLLADLREALAAVRDLERLIARIGAGGGNARDAKGVGASLDSLVAVKDSLATTTTNRLQAARDEIQLLPEIATLIRDAIEDEPPVTLKEGGIIREGYHAELDELRAAASDARRLLAEFQSAEQERTGIKTLKVRHNRVFGYYIEVSKGQVDNVPDTYARKQTLTNAERFITPELKEFENKILGAQDRSRELEHELFTQIRGQIVDKTAEIQATAAALAEIDALASLADRALACNFTRPTMTDGDGLRITDCRHPVIEQLADGERFVPNDVKLDCDSNQIMIITGPNMAGKSTYIRQVALMVVMAQMGSFIPAAAAEMGLVDRVFTRVGASDDLASGRSTFLVEMQETANILNNATARSLIVLDEIGRGTSTFDGISIAWAVAEHLHNTKAVKAKTLFATHYHELTDLAVTLKGVKNYNIMVRERDDAIVFLRKLAPGGADKSYGIQVARLAGLPDPAIDRAREILANLEEGEFSDAGQPKIARQRRKSKEHQDQLALFDL